MKWMIALLVLVAGCEANDKVVPTKCVGECAPYAVESWTGNDTPAFPLYCRCDKQRRLCKATDQ